MRSRGPCSCNEDSAFLRAKLTETGRLQWLHSLFWYYIQHNKLVTAQSCNLLNTS
jgi:hypothetical protein